MTSTAMRPPVVPAAAGSAAASGVVPSLPTAQPATAATRSPGASTPCHDDSAVTVLTNTPLTPAGTPMNARRLRFSAFCSDSVSPRLANPTSAAPCAA